MNDLLAQAARALNPALALIITAAGALWGATIVPPPVGLVIGLVSGAAVALALCGAVAMLANLTDRSVVSAVAQTAKPDIRAQIGNVAAVPAPAYAHGGHAMNGHAPALLPGAVVVPSTVPAEAGVAAVAELVTANESQLLAQGQFDHLAKAKRLYAAGDAVQAAYQASASLAHGELPGELAEATELRNAARAASKQAPAPTRT